MRTTLEELRKIDIVDRLHFTISQIVNEVGPDPHDIIIYDEPDSFGLSVSDMLHDAIVEINRLRNKGK